MQSQINKGLEKPKLLSRHDFVFLLKPRLRKFPACPGTRDKQAPGGGKTGKKPFKIPWDVTGRGCASPSRAGLSHPSVTPLGVTLAACPGVPTPRQPPTSDPQLRGHRRVAGEWGAGLTPSQTGITPQDARRGKMADVQRARLPEIPEELANRAAVLE